MLGTTAAALMWWFAIQGRKRGEAIMQQRYAIAFEADFHLRNPRVVIAPLSDPAAGTRDPEIILHWIFNDIPITWRTI